LVDGRAAGLAAGQLSAFSRVRGNRRCLCSGEKNRPAGRSPAAYEERSAGIAADDRPRSPQGLDARDACGHSRSTVRFLAVSSSSITGKPTFPPASMETVYARSGDMIFDSKILCDIIVTGPVRLYVVLESTCPRRATCCGAWRNWRWSNGYVPARITAWRNCS